MKTLPTVPVTSRALLQRINRRLQRDGERVRAYRGGRSWSQLGDFYRFDTKRNFLCEGHVDLEGLGRELGVLKPYEGLAED
jgi:hypothetical protein